MEGLGWMGQLPHCRLLAWQMAWVRKKESSMPRGCSSRERLRVQAAMVFWDEFETPQSCMGKQLSPRLRVWVNAALDLKRHSVGSPVPHQKSVLLPPPPWEATDLRQRLCSSLPHSGLWCRHSLGARARPALSRARLALAPLHYELEGRTKLWGFAR